MLGERVVAPAQNDAGHAAIAIVASIDNKADAFDHDFVAIDEQTQPASYHAGCELGELVLIIGEANGWLVLGILGLDGYASAAQG